MFEILSKSIAAGVVTTDYPQTPVHVARTTRGRPAVDFANWRDTRRAAQVCPTGAIGWVDRDSTRSAFLDLAKCTFCGLCAEVEPAIVMSNDCELAAHSRRALITTAKYLLNSDGTHKTLLEVSGNQETSGAVGGETRQSLERLTENLKRKIDAVFGRSLHIREVDAGSCNGCEVEIVGLNSPVYDIERFGIHFVASPRHADLLLVTGPVTRNMELALRKTYDAMPAPRLVVAVGACGCSGGIFGENYACLGGVDKVLPVDVFVPGCPPNPHALLQGILMAVGRWGGTARLTRSDPEQ
jgi:Ni,Fe-hydrogenase III small subunit/formate hydrogenlyase subunit 6/NADH:ubiquinone oxidoreductase subunit I